MAISSQQLGDWYAELLSAQQAGRFDDALESVEKILAHAHDVPQVYARKGEILWSLKRFEEALRNFDLAIALAPGDAELHFGRGTALQSLRKYQDALEAYARVLALNPSHMHALNNKAASLGELGRIDEALKAYEQAIAASPTDVGLHVSKAMCLMSLGRLEEAWPDWEWRVRKYGSEGPVPRDACLWRGEALAGKTLLLQAEQGLGDTIQFSRYALVARDMGANVILQVHDRLARLLRSLDGITVIAASAPLLASDYRLMLMSMPGRLRTSLATVATFPAYLAPEQALFEMWRHRLGGAGFRIGISWQGERTYRGQERAADAGRSFPVSLFAGIAAIRGVRLISLQKNEGVEQLATLPEGMMVETLGDGFDAGADGFCDCAAVMKNLDLVITSDTAVAHLAGALGVPVWLVLKKVPDWRWLLQRTDSPWYPSMILFRQEIDGDWVTPFRAMESQLRAEIVSHS